jgi:hypothetical protein
MDRKRCTKCGVEFPVTTEFFFTDKTKSDGLYSSCKECRRQYRNETREHRKAWRREHRRQNSEAYRAKNKAYYDQNREQIREKARQRRNERLEEFRDKARSYRIRNREHIRQHQLEYRSRIREKVNRKNKEYRDNDRDGYRDSQRRHYANHRQRNLNRSREYAQNNQHIIRAVRHRYNARKRGLPSMFTKQDCEHALAYFGHRCAYCSAQLETITFDHYIPLISPNGPGTVKENMLPVCFSCNCSKKASDAETWLRRRFGDEKAQGIILRIYEYFASLTANN